MLSRSYEPKHVALSCLHPGVETENYRAFVTLHLSSDEEFLLNVKKSTLPNLSEGNPNKS